MARKLILSQGEIINFFHNQVRYLIDQKFDLLAEENNGNMFLKELETIGKWLKKQDYIPFHQGNVPLLVVVSRKIVGIQKQMMKIRIDGKPGNSRIVAPSRYGGSEKSVYVIFDVNTGGDLGWCAAIDTKMILRMDGRAGLLIEEGIALARHYPQLLSEKGWYLVASMRDAPPAVPTIVFNNDDGGICLTLTRGTARRNYETPSRGTEFDS